ncbi:MAG: peptidoglycan DD-metalloendopeptidase family protein [Chitinophagaceae bacterium]
MNASSNIFIRNQASFYPMLNFTVGKDKLAAVDLSGSATDLYPSIIEDTALFAAYIHKKTKGAKFGLGGYAEYREVYSRSSVFDAEITGGEPRRLHLGTDIWGTMGTPVFAPIGGMIHGFGFNDNFGDYGATLILQHQLEGFGFYTLYGHISLADINHIQEGEYVIRGQEIAHFGNSDENGHWPPHLHFQVIFDIGMNRSDYPGVCRYSDREKYLSNCPDPDLILQLNQYL